MALRFDIVMAAAAVVMFSTVFAAESSGGRWWKRSYPGYVLHSNRRGKTNLGRIVKDLNESREVFNRYLPSLKNIRPAVGIIRIYDTRAQYIAAAGKDMEWSGGLWNGRELLISPPSGNANYKEVRKFTRQVLFHEGFHQYISGAVKKQPIPLWFNEGCAQVFENIDSRGRVRITAKTEKLLAEAVEKMQTPIVELMRLDHKSFYRADVRQQNYLTAFALLYYLLKGTEKTRYRGMADLYLQKLISGIPELRALQETLQKYDAEKLDKDFRKFWHTPRRLRSARNFEPSR